MESGDHSSKIVHLQEQHTNWTSFDKARAISGIQTSTGMSETEIANTLGLDPRTVLGYISLLSLSKRTVQFSVEKRIPFTHLRGIASVVRPLNVKDRGALEQALIEKVASGVIAKSSDINKLGVVTRNGGGKKAIKQMIDDPEYTVQEALVDSGVLGDMQIRTIISNTNWIRSAMKKSTELGFNKNLDAVGVTALEKLVEEIEAFIESAGYISK